MTFADGVGYIATQTINRRNKIIVVAAGRMDGELAFVRVSDIANAMVEVIDGRETALLKFPDGEYFVSASVKADPGAAKRVLDAIERSR